MCDDLAAENFLFIIFIIIFKINHHNFSQLSRVVGMSEFLWLIILPSNTTTQDLLKEVDTPFDALIITACIEDTVHLEEAYRVDPSYPLRVQKYGSWDGTKLTAPSFLFLYNQRKDMEGFPVKAATKDVSKNIILVT